MSKKNPALVSIIIPTYKTTWFEETLASAVDQDYPNCEIIVSDDSPFGEPEQIVERFKAKSRHPIRYFRNQPALGDIGNYNHCFLESKGEYVKLFADDDLLAPSCVSKLVDAIEAREDIRIATSRRQRINAEGLIQEDIFATASPVNVDSVIHGEDILAFQSRGIVNFIGEPCTVLMYREDIVALIDSPDSWYKIDGQVMEFLEDLTFYTKILTHSHLAYLAEPLSFFRISRQQKSESGRAQDPRAQNSHDTYLKFASAYTEQHGLDPAKGVRIAPLYSNDAFRYAHIRETMGLSLKENYFQRWLAERRVLPIQRKLINDFIEAGQLQRTLTVIIDGTQATEAAIVATYDSLLAQHLQGVQFEVVVIGESDVQGVRHYPAQSNPIAAINSVLAETQGEWVICVTAGVTFHPGGLNALETTLGQAGELLAVYCDETGFIDEHLISARFRPDFNFDLLLSAPYNMAHHWLWRRELLQAVNGFDENYPQAFELNLALKIVETQGFNSIGHLAEPLLNVPFDLQANADEVRAIQQHLANRGYNEAQIELTSQGNYRLDYGHAMTPVVSIVIVADNDLASLVACVMSLIENTRWLNYELVMVVSDTIGPEGDNWLASVVAVDEQRVKVQRYQGDLHYAQRVNLGASIARGEYLVLVNALTAFIDKNWLHELMNHALRPEVGIVGGKQVYADGTVSNAGYVLGMNGVVGDAFLGTSDTHNGLMSRLHAVQNYSAVSGDFMLVRQELFAALQGFDESMTRYSDVDFCLRSREAGFLTVWTPYAKLLRSVEKRQSEESEEIAPVSPQVDHEEDRLYSRWMPLITNDPAYSPHLSLSSNHFNVCPDSHLSWRPLGWNPLPVVLAHMGDFFGCGNYRIIKPFEAMRDHGLVDGKLQTNLLSVPYLERYKPDSIVFQRQITPEYHQWATKIAQHNSAFKVFELDDYLPNIPLKNHHRKDFGNDVLKMVRKSLSFADRFVVSTAPLAEAFAGMHPDIVVRKNCLSLDWWGNLQSLRHQSKKPRVGWAGGSSHTGDLEMIFDVVKAFADRVDWVFFGMCPPKLRPYVKEFHLGVEIGRYPAKLASLNLDLALAPVEDNAFNVCKSNLRLLEYGACAVPVICSDVECYRDDLPVTRVKNRFKDWHEAILMHLNDPDTSEKQGKALYEAVMRDFTLNEVKAREWAAAWLP